MSPGVFGSLGPAGSTAGALAAAGLVAALAVDGAIAARGLTATSSAPAELVAGATAPRRSLAERFSAEAGRLRAGDCAGARRDLAKRAAETSEDAAAATLLGGFFAHACGDFVAAVEPLHRSAPAPAETDPSGLGELEDWRLLLLGLDARTSRQTVLGLAAFQRLLAEHRESPLWSAALLEAVSTARGAGQLERAAEWIERGLAAQGAADPAVAGDARRSLERQALEVARARADRPAARAAARRLLVEYPFDAAELRAVDALRDTSGGVDWFAELGAADLERRAGTLLDLGVTAGALSALDAVPAERRGATWQLLRARGLILDDQAREALRVLDAAPAAAPGARSQPPRGEHAWVRALAYGELLRTSAAGRRRGQAVLAEAERAFFLQARREALSATAADPATALALRQAALRHLFADLSQAQLHDQALDALLDLRVLAPDDLSGARYLWERGWTAMRQGQDAAASRTAIERWHRLIASYPESRYARSAQYWTARALERLGELAPAAASYRALAASDTADFYRRHALARLARVAKVSPAPAPFDAGPGDRAPAMARRASWPLPTALERARLLSDLGLDALARVELDALAGRPAIDHPSLLALRALVAARSGERRESLRLLAEAFPALAGAHQDDLSEDVLRLFYPLDFESTVRALAKAEGLPPAVVFAMIHQESGFDANAVSRSGARGLMQLMPPTARELSRKLGLKYSLAGLARPEISVRLGTTYFRQVLGMFDGNLELALVGYNSGPYGIRKRWHGDPDELDSFVEDLSPDEPKIYVKRILALADTYRRLHPQLG